MRWGIIVGAVALVLAGCGAASVPPSGTALEVAPRPVGPPPEETAYTRGIIKHDEQLALHQVEDTTASAGQQNGDAACGLSMENVPTGLALVFTASKGESVEALRQRVRVVAAQYNDRDPDAQKLTQDVMHMKKQLMAFARVENVPRGARLVLETGETGQVEALRALVRWHASDLLPGISAEIGRHGPCPSLPKPLMG